MVDEKQENSNLEKKTVIVVKLPEDVTDRLFSFPFLHTLSDIYKIADFHLISNVSDIEILNLLPFKAFYHSYEAGELSSLMDAHRFAVNAKIFNVDIFINLTDSFIDSSLGYSLRAKTRLGFKGNFKKIFLNQSMERPTGLHRSEDYLSLLNLHLNRFLDSKIRIISRDLPPIIDSWEQEPYIAINLSNPDANFIQDKWVELINHFEEEKIIFFASNDQEKIQFMMEGFLPRLSKKNTYESFILKNWIDIAKMTSYAKGVITFEGSGSLLAAYSGTKTIALFQNENPQIYGPNHFLADVMTLDFKGAVNMGLVADKAHSFFKL